MSRNDKVHIIILIVVGTAVMALAAFFAGCTAPEGFEKIEALACCDCGLVHRVGYYFGIGGFYVRVTRDDVLTEKWRAEVLPRVGANDVLVRQLDGGLLVFGVTLEEMMKMVEEKQTGP